MAKRPAKSKAAPKVEAKAEASTPKESAVQLVRMKRGEKFADVNPAEVDNFKGGGWVEAE